MSSLAKYKTYPEYKDSYSRWYSEIPNAWDRLSLKFITSNFVKDGPHETPKFVDFGVPFLSVDGIQNNNLVFENCRYISNEDHFRYSLKCKPTFGDILLGKAASIGKVAIVETNIEFNVWSPLAVITPKNYIFSKYIYYSLQSINLQVQCDLYSNSNTQKNLGMGTIDNLQFLKPSDYEVKKIAEFLDHETAKMDQLIEKQQKLIELLKEKRQAVISHAVTKGLDPHVKMKDSGVEWLGDVPEHWDVKPFKRFFKIRKRIAGTLGYDILSITQRGIKIKDIESGDGQLSMDYSKYQIINKGDFAMNHMDLLTGFVDISSYLGVTSPDYRVFTLEDCSSDSQYYLYLLQMCYINKIFYPLGQGAANIGRWRLPTEAFNEFNAPVPPYTEQKNISIYIKQNLDLYFSLIEKAEYQINLLKERRTALISAAVTGKIDVRDWQAENEKITV